MTGKRTRAVSGDPSPEQVAAPPRFEEALEKLQHSVRRLEGGELDLSDALACYEEGIRQLKICYDVLEQAERRIELLCGVDVDGNPVTTPYSDEELTLEQKREARGQRRTHALQIDDPPPSQ